MDSPSALLTMFGAVSSPCWMASVLSRKAVIRDCVIGLSWSIDPSAIVEKVAMSYPIFALVLPSLSKPLLLPIYADLNGTSLGS